MGNGSSTIITIDLNDRKFTNDQNDYSVKTLNVKQQDNCETVTYQIDYKGNNVRYDIHLVLGNSEPVFKYLNPSSEDDRIRELRSFFSKEHNKRPIVVGLKGKFYDYDYYIYTELLYIKSANTITIDRLDPFGELNLNERLKYETDVIKKENTLTSGIAGGEARIYLSNKGDTESTYTVKIKSKVTCSIDLTKQFLDKYKNILKVNYSLIYFGDLDFNFWHDTWYRYSNSYYYLKFYTGTDKSNEGKCIFTYYPRKNTYTIIEVEAYSCLMYINQPFLLVFKTNNLNYLYSSYDNLDSRRSGYNDDLKSTDYKDKDALISQTYYQKFKKVKFESGNSPNENFKMRQYEFNHTDKSSNVNKFRKVILISDGGSKGSIVYSDRLFTLNCSDCLPPSNRPNSLQSSQAPKITNKPIGKSVLSKCISSEYDGIVVCYSFPGEIALLAEFYKDRNTKHQFVRRDFEGDIWAEQTHEYNSDVSLAAKLYEIELEIAKKTTYLLENNINYTDDMIKVTRHVQKGFGYSIYKHESISSGNLVETKVLYQGKAIQTVQNATIVKSNEKIDKLEGKIFTEISMYAADNNSSTHLIMNLKTSTNSYYIHRLDINGIKWRQMNLEDLVEMGAMHQQLLDVMKRGTVSGGLSERLNRMLSQPETTKLLLNNLSVSICSIMVLIDKTNGYNKSDVQKIVGNPGSEYIIPPAGIDNSIQVDEVQDTPSESCVYIKGYKLYTHTMTSAVKKTELIIKRSKLFIRLYWGIKMIFLYEDTQQTSPHYIEHNKTNDKLYVYFNKNGNMPLLIFYNGAAYKPKNGDLTSWVKIKEIKACTKLYEHTIKSELDRLNSTVRHTRAPTRSTDKKPNNSASSNPSNLQLANSQGSHSPGGSTQEQSHTQHPGSPIDQIQSTGGHNHNSLTEHPTSSIYPENTESSGTISLRTEEQQTGKEPARSSSTAITHTHTTVRTESGASESSALGESVITSKEPIETKSALDSGKPSQNTLSGSNSTDNGSNNKTTDAAVGASVGGAGAIGSGVGGYLLYSKLILPRR